MSKYDEVVAAHRWDVPERYNIAADVCDRHPREKLAMIHEDPSGTVRRVTWGELQDRSRQIANLLRDRGVERGDRVAVVLPATPDAAATFFAVYRSGAILLSMSVLYGDEGVKRRLTDSAAKVLVTDAANRERFAALGADVLLLDGADEQP